MSPRCEPVKECSIRKSERAEIVVSESGGSAVVDQGRRRDQSRLGVMSENHFDILLPRWLVSPVMATITHDIQAESSSLRPPRRGGRCLAWVSRLLAAASFGLSGSLAKGMLEAGWSPGAAVTVRIGLAAMVLAIPAMISLRGRRRLLRGNWRLIIVYGLVAVAGCQLGLLQRRRPYGRRHGAADRVLRPRRRGGLALVPLLPTTQPRNSASVHSSPGWAC